MRSGSIRIDAHEVRRVVDREVRPVVAVGQDVAAVVGVPADPRVQRRREPGVLDAAPLVPEAALRIEADGALARPALGGREAEELGVVAGLHGRVSVVADAGLTHLLDASRERA